MKKIIVGKESGLSWTKELEGERLSFDVYRDLDNVSSAVALTPVVMGVIEGSADDDVYPELVGFGSLDTRGMPDDLYNFINDFCFAFEKNIYDGPQKYFDEKYLFNYVFFRNYLIEDWKTFVGSDFPERDSINPGLFYDWILAAPISSGEIMQQPVRFYCNYGYVDFVLYIRLDNKKIYQISRGVFGK